MESRFNVPVVELIDCVLKLSSSSDGDGLVAMIAVVVLILRYVLLKDQKSGLDRQEVRTPIYNLHEFFHVAGVSIVAVLVVSFIILMVP